jgi:hypothetical protein
VDEEIFCNHPPCLVFDYRWEPFTPQPLRGFIGVQLRGCSGNRFHRLSVHCGLLFDLLDAEIVFFFAKDFHWPSFLMVSFFIHF